MLIVALLEFIPNPKKAIQSIPGVLQTNVRMNGNHLVLHRRSEVQKVITTSKRMTLKQ
jgi:hypothetical protein